MAELRAQLVWSVLRASSEQRLKELEVVDARVKETNGQASGNGILHEFSHRLGNTCLIRRLPIRGGSATARSSPPPSGSSFANGASQVF